MNEETLILLIVFQIKHLIADYYLQFPYMYMNKGAKHNWIRPLFDHAMVHSMMTLIIVGTYLHNDIMLPMVLLVTAFDFITHFITDRWKATRGRKPDESKFWTDLGIDQMIHHIVGILIVFWIIT